MLAAVRLAASADALARVNCALIWMLPGPEDAVSGAVLTAPFTVIARKSAHGVEAREQLRAVRFGLVEWWACLKTANADAVAESSVSWTVQVALPAAEGAMAEAAVMSASPAKEGPSR
jgi:hypothetical protein